MMPGFQFTDSNKVDVECFAIYSQTFTGASTFVPVQVMKVLPVTVLDKVNDRFQSN